MTKTNQAPLSTRPFFAQFGQFCNSYNVFVSIFPTRQLVGYLVNCESEDLSLAATLDETLSLADCFIIVAINPMELLIDNH